MAAVGELCWVCSAVHKNAVCGNGMGLRAGAAAAMLLASAPLVAQGVPVTVLCWNEAVVVLWVPAAQTCGEQPQGARDRLSPAVTALCGMPGGVGLGCPCWGEPVEQHREDSFRLLLTGSYG